MHNNEFEHLELLEGSFVLTEYADHRSHITIEYELFPLYPQSKNSIVLNSDHHKSEIGCVAFCDK